MTTLSIQKNSLPNEFIPGHLPAESTFNFIDFLLNGDRVDKQSAINLRLEIDPKLHLALVDPKLSQSVLHKAAQKADAMVLKVFCEKNCLNDVPDANNDTPFMILLERYLEKENRADLREVICTFLQKGARLDFTNNQGISALTRILCSENELLFHHCMDKGSPWAHAFIYVCTDSEEIHPFILDRLNKVSIKPEVKQSIIIELLRTDFSSKPRALCQMLGHLLEGSVYSPPWLDGLKRDENSTSIFCKMEILSKKFDKPLRNHFFGLGYDKKPEYNELCRWFAPKDRPQKSSSCGHSPRESVPEPLRIRGNSVNEFDSLKKVKGIQQLLEGSDAQKRIGKANIATFIISQDREVIAVLQEILLKNSKLINQKYNGTFLLILTIRARCFAMTQFLLSHGAEPNVYDDEYNTPLHHVVLTESERHCADTVALLGYLINKGSSVDAMNRETKSPVNLLFEAGKAELFEPFFQSSIDWVLLVEKEIEKGSPRNENEKKCISQLVRLKIISPKAVLKALLKCTFEEKHQFPKELLLETLQMCEKIEAVEVDLLSKDGKEESVREKVKVLKQLPKFYLDIIHYLFQQSNFSYTLLWCMLDEKEPEMVPDYDLIFKDEDKRSRRNKFQILTDKSLIETVRSAEQLASKKTLGCLEAFVLGLVSLMPESSSFNWVDVLREYGSSRKTLTLTQVGFLRKVIPKDAVFLRAIIGMLFQQDLCRSDPLLPSPFEVMLEIVIPDCKIFGHDWIDFILNDKDPISYQRKLDICEKHVQLSNWLKHHLKLKKEILRSSSPGQLEQALQSAISQGRVKTNNSEEVEPRLTKEDSKKGILKSSSSSSSRSSKSGSRSQPGSGSTTPRGSGREKKH